MIGTRRTTPRDTTLYYLLPVWLVSVATFTPLIDAMLERIHWQAAVTSTQLFGPELVVLLYPPDDQADTLIRKVISDTIRRAAGCECEFYLIDA